jgi:hypothetical protein
MPGVVAVHRSRSHSFSKYAQDCITLLAGLGVAGDAHAGSTVRHRSRVRRDPSAPNLRQVHLLHGEAASRQFLEQFGVQPGQLGENVTTRGLDLLALPAGTRLQLGPQSVLELTGLRNPCAQIDAFQQGLTAAVLDRDAQGGLVRKAGVMAVVVQGGDVRPGDAVVVSLPAQPHRPLVPV